MELSQLTAYAQLKFHMREQRPWPDFPGFSVLADPVTGKWAALLMPVSYTHLLPGGRGTLDSSGG